MTTENKDEASPSTSGTGMYKVIFYPSFVICGFYTAYQCCGSGSGWIQNFWLGPDPKKSFRFWVAPDPQ